MSLFLRRKGAVASKYLTCRQGLWGNFARSEWGNIIPPENCGVCQNVKCTAGTSCLW